jgi:acetyl esterase/lipase
MFAKRSPLLFALAALAFLAPARGEAQDKKGPALPEGTKVEMDLAYGPHKERNVLDLYVPKSEAALPLVIWVHGGGWQQGSKAGGPALGLLSKGYAVASINYRLSQQAVYPAQIEDCKAAVRFLRANAKEYNLDPDHFGVWGASAGGHLVALLGTTAAAKELEGDGGNKEVSSKVQAVVDWFGPTDLTKMGGSHDNPNSPEAKLLGGPVQENKDKAAKANPITYVTKDAAPFLILHGDQDKTVPYSQSELLAEALKKAGVEVRLVKVEGAGHGGAQFNAPENRKLIEEFFDKHLKAKK